MSNLQKVQSSSVVSPRSPKCPTCDKSVYFNEQVMALEKAWHKRCLKCNQCNKVVDPGNFSDRQGKIYCKFCYASVAGLKGYGYGALNESHVSGGAVGKTEGGNVDTNPGIEGGVTGHADFRTHFGAESNPQQSPSNGNAFCPSCGTKCAGGPFCAGCGTKI